MLFVEEFELIKIWLLIPIKQGKVRNYVENFARLNKNEENFENFQEYFEIFAKNLYGKWTFPPIYTK